MPDLTLAEKKSSELHQLAGKVVMGKIIPSRISPEQGQTILIVEDNDLLRETLCEVLQALHPEWSLVEARNGLEGFNLAQRLHPDLIVLDFNMPVMNGYELALMLQNQPETSAIPLVLNSAEDADHPLIMRLRTMCKAVLGKPFSLHEVERMICTILAAPAPTYAAPAYVTGAYGEWGGWQPALS